MTTPAETRNTAIRPNRQAPDLARERLYRQLDSIEQLSLISIEALAGYGKSTLIRQWLELHDRAKDCTYLNLVPWLHSEQALCTFIAEYYDTPPTSLPELVKAIHQQQPGKLWIIDELGSLKPALQAKLVEVITGLNGKLITVNRQPLAFKGLSRLIAHDRVAYITAPALSYTKEETETYLQQRELKLTRKQLQQLHETLLGWPIAVKLYADQYLELTKSQRTALTTLIPERLIPYVAEECLDLPEDSPLLDIMDQAPVGKLANAEPQQLEQLQHLGIIQADGTATFHPVISHCVNDHLAQTDSKKLQAIKNHAVKQQLKQGAYNDALELLCSSQQWKKAATIITDIGFGFIQAGNGNALYHFIQRFPADFVNSNPQLLYFLALCQFEHRRDDLQTPTALLEKAEALLLKNNSDADEALLKEIYLLKARFVRLLSGEQSADNITYFAVKKAATSQFALGAATDLGRAMESYCRGDLAVTESALEEAIRHGKQENFQLAVVLGISKLAYVLLRTGRSTEALHRREAVMEWVLDKETQIFPKAYLQNGALVPLFIESHDIHSAEAGLEILQQFSRDDDADPQQQLLISVFEALIYRAKGQYEEFDKALERASGLVIEETDNWNWYFTSIPALRAETAIEQGNTLSAAYWAEQNGAALAARTDFRSEAQRLILARIYVEQQYFIKAEQLLETITQSAVSRGDLQHEVWSYIIASIAAYQQDKLKDSKRLFDQAINKACHANYRQLFLSQGDIMLAVFEHWQKSQLKKTNKASLQTFSHELMGLLKAKYPGVDGTDTAEALLDPLSDRELEVLNLIAQGLRNKAIAEQLGLAPATIKAHLYNSYSKLNVGSRTEAIARARSLSLID